MIIYSTSTEGKILEDPKNRPPEIIFNRTKSIENSPSKATIIKIGFKNSDPVSLNGKKFNPEKLLKKLNELGGKHGVGRVDLVENRFLELNLEAFMKLQEGRFYMLLTEQWSRLH